jgi:hypothetical protein
LAYNMAHKGVQYGPYVGQIRPIWECVYHGNYCLHLQDRSDRDNAGSTTVRNIGTNQHTLNGVSLFVYLFNDAIYKVGW